VAVKVPPAVPLFGHEVTVPRGSEVALISTRVAACETAGIIARELSREESRDKARGLFFMAVGKFEGGLGPIAPGVTGKPGIAKRFRSVKLFDGEVEILLVNFRLKAPFFAPDEALTYNFPPFKILQRAESASGGE
jgi:hypothetical protein